MKRNLVLSANAAPLVGGQGLNLFHVVQGLSQYFDISLFCQQNFPSHPTQVVPPSALSTWLGKMPVLRRLRDVRNRWSDTHFDHWVAERLPKAELFQGVGGQCHRSLEIAKKQGCGTVVDCITTHIDDFCSHQRRECAKFGIRPATSEWMRRRTVEEYQRADLIRTLSQHARTTFLERGLKNVIVARPQLDVSEFPEAKFQEPLFRVSFVGLLEPWKGFHYLVDAFNQLDLPDSELVFWGGAGSRAITEYLQAKMAANPKIQVRPVEVRKCYGEVYAKSTVLVHPSLSEGFGYVVAEAMASGLPVIVSRNSGSADLVVDGVNGFVVPAADPEAIRDRLAYLAKNPALVKQMGGAARESLRTRNRDEWRTYASAIEKLAC